MGNCTLCHRGPALADSDLLHWVCYIFLYIWVCYIFLYILKQMTKFQKHNDSYHKRSSGSYSQFSWWDKAPVAKLVVIWIFFSCVILVLGQFLNCSLKKLPKIYMFYTRKRCYGKNKNLASKILLSILKGQSIFKYNFQL